MFQYFVAYVYLHASHVITPPSRGHSHTEYSIHDLSIVYFSIYYSWLFVYVFITIYADHFIYF